MRGLFEIVLKRRWARLTTRVESSSRVVVDARLSSHCRDAQLLDWCLMLDRRQWDWQTPLRQLEGALASEILVRPAVGRRTDLTSAV